MKLIYIESERALVNLDNIACVQYNRAFNKTEFYDSGETYVCSVRGDVIQKVMDHMLHGTGVLQI